MTTRKKPTDPLYHNIKIYLYVLASGVALTIVGFALGGDLLDGFAGGTRKNSQLHSSLLTVGVYSTIISLNLMLGTLLVIMKKRLNGLRSNTSTYPMYASLYLVIGLGIVAIMFLSIASLAFVSV